MIILLYGQPCSGKSTLADGIYQKIKESGVFIRIDGDLWREVTNNTDYSKEGRMKNLKTAFDMAIYLELLGFIPILSFVTPYKQSRKYLRKNSKQFVEIYLTYDEDRGRNNYFATDFEEPENYNLKINTSVLSIDECIQEIIQYCETQYTDFSFANPQTSL